MAKIEETIKWLYAEGAHASGEVYKQKLIEFK